MLILSAMLTTWESLIIVTPYICLVSTWEFDTSDYLEMLRTQLFYFPLFQLTSESKSGSISNLYLTSYLLIGTSKGGADKLAPSCKKQPGNKLCPLYLLVCLHTELIVLIICTVTIANINIFAYLFNYLNRISVICNEVHVLS